VTFDIRQRHRGFARRWRGPREDQQVSDFPSQLLENWAIPAHPSARIPQLGAMNETWLLEWPGERAVLRRHRRSARAQVEFEHSVLAHARAGGVPCPSVITTGQGGSLVEQDGRFYSLYTWAPGLQVLRGHLDAEHALSMGRMLALTHLVLADMPGGPEAHELMAPFEDTLGRIEELIGVARARPDQRRLGWVIDDLTARSRWLSTTRPSPPRPTTAASQLIHGDYQDANLFFEAGEVSCVIDWDKARREVPAREVVRAMDYALGTEPFLCQQFLTGYRGFLPIAPDELDEAADWFSYQETTLGLWPIEQLLLHNNDRAENATDHRPFVAFSQRWHAASLAG
jgi:Ser/Thr protein kinase RdoA (MazF antagonist)